MVLKEIRTVLSSRSADWMERERKVRQRKGLPELNDDLENLENPSSEQESLTDILSKEIEDPPDSRNFPQEFENSPCTFNPSEVALHAALAGSKWVSRSEELFGSESDLSDDET